MYTNSCCYVSCVSSVHPSSSVSQVNSSIEIFSQLPVFRVGLTCSSLSFGFCVFWTVFSPFFLIQYEAVSLESP